MKLTTVIITLLLLAGCGPIPPPEPPTPPPPSVFCIAPSISDRAHQPVEAAQVSVAGLTGETDKDGYLYLQPIPSGDNKVSVKAQGFIPFSFVYTATSWTCDVPVSLDRARPAPPTRDEMLAVHITFQGLMVPTQQFGTLPWFEAALPWLSPSDRAAVYQAKHASTAWAGGDTHALIFVPSGPPLYDEPNQPYSADRFPAKDWTGGNTRIDPALPALVEEVVEQGFNRVLLFLGGDAGEAGFPIAMTQLGLVSEALQHSPYGDLRPYVVPFPGFDGVFYGYTPQHIFDWGAKCRTLFIYCGIEHSTGHIPTGEGDADWTNSGGMRAFDLVLSEFDDGRFDDTVWQISARLIGPKYVRPPEQPSGDDPRPPFYLRESTTRGPIINCAFEFKEYTFVRDQDVAAVNKARDYFKHVGHTCGGYQ